MIIATFEEKVQNDYPAAHKVKFEHSKRFKSIEEAEQAAAEYTATPPEEKHYNKWVTIHAGTTITTPLHPVYLIRGRNKQQLICKH